MERINVTRSYLETLSSTDLIALSDDYGIETENLSRCFIITEILDAQEEQEPSTYETDEQHTDTLELPFSYNENKIIAVMRNPVWCYTTWDFKRDTYSSHIEDPTFESFMIRISYHADTETDIVKEVFDVQITPADREQFILLSADYPSFHASLVASFTDEDPEILATSQRILKPNIPLDINLAGLQKECLPIQSLSGLQSILKTHYNEHRHTFVKD